jgi:hypothetical protein
MTTPHTYYAIATGDDLAAMVNIETLIETPPHMLPGAGIPLHPPVLRRLVNGSIVRNGRIDSVLQWDNLLWTDFVTLMETLFAGVDGDDVAAIALSALDEAQRYSPFLANAGAPVMGENYQVATGGEYVTELALPLYDCVLQRTDRATSGAITASERLTRVNTASGSVTITLPALASVAANTVHSFVKTSASNNLVLSPPDALIDGAATKTITAVGRTDIINTGTGWITLDS